jgi:hypothetical protein
MEMIGGMGQYRATDAGNSPSGYRGRVPHHGYGPELSNCAVEPSKHS